MRFHNNIGPLVRRRRYALGWSQSMLATKLQLAGFDISRSGVSKIEARLRFVDDRDLMFLAEVLKVPIQERWAWPRKCRNRSKILPICLEEDFPQLLQNNTGWSLSRRL